MKQPQPQANWPEPWRKSYSFDCNEVFGPIGDHGYAYAYRNRAQKTIQLLTAAVPVGATVLDVAAAQGNFSLKLAELGYRVTWNDLRADLADYVRLKYEHGQIDYAAGNVFELALPHKFDAVLITEVIEHVAHPDEFLQKIAGLVRPGGYIVMTTPNGGYFRNKLPRFSDCPDPSVYEAQQFKPDSDGHIFLLHRDEVLALADRAGLIVDALILFTNPLTNGHVKTRPLLKLLPESWVFALENATERLPLALAQKTLVQLGARFKLPER